MPIETRSKRPARPAEFITEDLGWTPAMAAKIARDTTYRVSPDWHNHAFYQQGAERKASAQMHGAFLHAVSRLTARYFGSEMEARLVPYERAATLARMTADPAHFQYYETFAAEAKMLHDMAEDHRARALVKHVREESHLPPQEAVDLVNEYEAHRDHLFRVISQTANAMYRYKRGLPKTITVPPTKRKHIITEVLRSSPRAKDQHKATHIALGVMRALADTLHLPAHDRAKLNHVLAKRADVIGRYVRATREKRVTPEVLETVETAMRQHDNLQATALWPHLKTERRVHEYFLREQELVNRAFARSIRARVRYYTIEESAQQRTRGKEDGGDAAHA